MHSRSNLRILWFVVATGVIVLIILTVLARQDNSPSPQPSQLQGGQTDSSILVTSAVVATNGEVFAATNYGLFSSENLGDSWNKISLDNKHGFPPGMGDAGFIFDSGHDNLIAYCMATDSASLVDSIYKITQGFNYYFSHGGQSWHRFYPPSKAPTRSFANFMIASASESLIYGITASGGKDRVWKSTDCGKSWILTKLEAEKILTLQIDPEGTLFARIQVRSSFSHLEGERNVYRSQDEGLTWQLLSIREISSIAFLGRREIVAFNMARSYVSSSGNYTNFYYYSADDGKTWEEVPHKARTSEFQTSVCGDGSIIQVGFATTNYSDGVPGETWVLTRSEDRGRNWTSSGILGTGDLVGAYLWTDRLRHAVFCSSGFDNMYISTDNGYSWKHKIVR